MNTKHTPGPWTAYPLTKSYGVYDDYGTNVATVGKSFGVASERRRADANLIAAAPDLLEALLDLVALLPGPDLDDDAVQRRFVEKARAAIAKATGEQP